MEVRSLPPVLDSLVELAALAIETGQAAHARQILSAVLQHPSRTATAQEEAERLLAQLPPSLEPPSLAPDAETLVAALLRTGVPEAL